MTTDRLPIIRVIARALCHSMRGAKRDCFCDGDIKRCHAATLYDDFATAALFGLERAGYKVVQPLNGEIVKPADELEADIRRCVEAVVRAEAPDVHI